MPFVALKNVAAKNKKNEKKTKGSGRFSKKNFFPEFFLLCYFPPPLPLAGIFFVYMSTSPEIQWLRSQDAMNQIGRSQPILVIGGTSIRASSLFTSYSTRSERNDVELPSIQCSKLGHGLNVGHALLLTVDDQTTEFVQFVAMCLLRRGVFVWCVDAIPMRHFILQQLALLVVLCTNVTLPMRNQEEKKDTTVMLSNGTSSSSSSLMSSPFILLVDGVLSARELQKLHDWMFKIEPTVEEGSNQRSPEAHERNEWRLMILGAFSMVHILSRGDSGILRQCIGSAMLSVSRKAHPHGAVVDLSAEEISLRIGEVSKALRPVLTMKELEQEEALWVSNRISDIMQNDFIKFCEERVDRLTSDMVRGAHDGALRRIHSIGVEFGVSSSGNLLEADLQRFLKVVQDAEAKRCERTRHMRSVEGSSLPDRSVAEEGACLSRFLPARYRYWGTTNGLLIILVMSAFVFFSLFSRKNSS